MSRIGVVGGGAWRTALAQVAATAGNDVLLWAREAEVVEGIEGARTNHLFLPGRKLHRSIRATDEITNLDSAEYWLVVTPAQHMRSVLEAAPAGDRPLILCAKGIEERSGRLLHDVAREVRPGCQVAVLSGPTFAHEVADGMPTAVTLACEDERGGERIRELLAQPTFRIYHTDDLAGAEIGGAVKNVLAIACGVVEGKALGQNARAALIARGFAEMTRFGLARGARRETLAGLSGLGDLVLTCSSTSSRNFSLGKGIGEGCSAADLMADRRTIAEGAFTAPVLARIAEQDGIDMPIVAAVAALLDGSVTVDQALEQLLSRPPRPEAN